MKGLHDGAPMQGHKLDGAKIMQKPLREGQVKRKIRRGLRKGYQVTVDYDSDGNVYSVNRSDEKVSKPRDPLGLGKAGKERREIAKEAAAAYTKGDDFVSGQSSSTALKNKKNKTIQYNYSSDHADMNKINQKGSYKDGIHMLYKTGSISMKNSGNIYQSHPEGENWSEWQNVGDEEVTTRRGEKDGVSGTFIDRKQKQSRTSKNQMSDDAWKNYLANETPAQKEARLKRQNRDLTSSDFRPDLKPVNITPSKVVPVGTDPVGTLKPIPVNIPEGGPTPEKKQGVLTPGESDKTVTKKPKPPKPPKPPKQKKIKPPKPPKPPREKKPKVPRGQRLIERGLKKGGVCPPCPPCD